MNITINLTLDQEQQDVLAAKVAARNAAGSNHTITSHLAEVVAGSIAGDVAEAYTASLQRLGTAAANLPYANRKALIEQVENAIP